MHVDPLDIIRRIGQAPIGDPAAMQRHAAQLRADADHLTAVVSSVTARATSMPYEGPAADAFRAEMQSSVRDAQAAAEQLHEAASILQRAAGSVAAEQATWQRRFREVEAELLAAARATGQAWR
jgi:uncharacterized protein YukE